MCKKRGYREAYKEDIENARKFTDHGQTNAIAPTNNTEIALTLNHNTGRAIEYLWYKAGNKSAVVTETDIELARKFKLSTQVDAIKILPNSTDSLKVITKKQLEKLQEFGPFELERALEEGRKAVESVNYENTLEELQKFFVKYQPEYVKMLCQHREMLSTLERCIQNLDTFYTLYNEDTEDDALLEKFGDEIKDRYILNNQESLLATDTNNLDMLDVL